MESGEKTIVVYDEIRNKKIEVIDDNIIIKNLEE